MRLCLSKEGLDDIINNDVARFLAILEVDKNLQNNFTGNDVFNLFNVEIYEFTKKPFSKTMKADIIEFINKRILISPSKYVFLFRFGNHNDFSKGSRLGTGRFVTLQNIPKRDREFIESYLPREREKHHYSMISKEDWLKIRQRDAYMKIIVTSIGKEKAQEKAFRESKRNFNILKLVLGIGISNERRMEVPFFYYMKNMNTGRVQLAEESWKNFNIYKSPYSDKIIGQITNIILKTNQSDLEKRILNTIEIYGLIEHNTSSHVSFILCLIGLESLFLSSDDKDILGSKLAEKISFLLADVPMWFWLSDNLTMKQMEKIDKKYIQKHLLDSRLKLHYTVKKLYEKRSRFSHEGISTKQKNKEITTKDVILARSLLCWSVEILLTKTRKIKRIKKNPSSGKTRDSNSLDDEIERMRYA